MSFAVHAGEHPGITVTDLDRAGSGQRHYGDEHVRRSELIRAFLAAGLAARVIAEMVPCQPELPRRQRSHAGPRA